MWDDWMGFFAKKYPDCNMHSAIVSIAVIKRNDLDLTQKDLAKKSGISYRKIKRFENCYNISMLDLIKIYNALEMELISE
jgi:predicted transcriptional regulator